jgi:signal transduction histidine kinase
MKLLNKTNLFFIGVSSVIFCLGGILFYQLFKVIIDNDINNKLYDRKEYNLKQLQRSDSVILFQGYSANMVSIKEIQSFVSENERFSDTTIFDRIEGKAIAFRQLSFNAKIRDKAYAIRVRRSMIEHKELIEGVVLLEVLLFIAFVIVLTLVNNKVSKNIWAPFYFILDKINNYKVDSAQSVSLPRNSINEFNELAAAIEKMSVKIKNEFNIQKEFTENASHEIQTPLTIIRNKLEILLQSPALSKEQMDLISSVSAAAKRLSKLNEALIILSKIENRQFHEVKNVRIDELVQASLFHFDELIRIKSITVEKLYRETTSVTMHPYLAEMLVENLIINAIKHNVSPGKIIISIGKDTLAIANTGTVSAIDTEKLFQRFVKTNSSSSSLGLGLSIVKAICDTYLFSICYSEKNGLHRMAVHFSQQVDQ